MRVFLTSVIVAAAMAVGAALILGGVQKSADEAFSTTGVRLGTSH